MYVIRTIYNILYIFPLVKPKILPIIAFYERQTVSLIFQFSWLFCPMVEWGFKLICQQNLAQQVLEFCLFVSTCSFCNNSVPNMQFLVMNHIQFCQLALLH